MRAKGWVRDLPDHRDLLFHQENRVYRAGWLPKTVDLWPHCPTIWDQGQLGSCTAHGSLRVFLIEAMRQGVTMPMPSRLMEYYDTRQLEGTTGSDSGGQVRDAIKALAKTGVAPEVDWPYDIKKYAQKPPAVCYQDAKQYMSLEYQRIVPGSGKAPMRTALSQGYSIVFGFNVPDYFEDQSWNPAMTPLPLPGPDTNYIGGHCVAITGYDFTNRGFFICDNSWGYGWGGQWGAQGPFGGRFAMDYKWFDGNLATDLWIIKQVS